MTWNRVGSDFIPDGGGDTVKQLKPGVYKIGVTQKGGFYLTYTAPSFELPEKVYDICNGFIDRVITYWDKEASNLGVLLTGPKGTSKTITGKIISNRLGLPVLIVDGYFGILGDILDQIDQDIVVFLDEFEKTTRGKDGEDISHLLLSILDGVAGTAGHRRLYLATSNELHIDPNFLNRTGRVRYHRQFKGLGQEAIRLIAADALLNSDYTEDLVETAGKITLASVDIILALIAEINLFNRPASELIEDMNISTKDYQYRLSIREVREGGQLYVIADKPYYLGPIREIGTYPANCYNFTRFLKNNGSPKTGEDFFIDDMLISGQVEEVIDSRTAIIAETEDSLTYTGERTGDDYRQTGTRYLVHVEEVVISSYEDPRTIVRYIP